MADIKDYAKEKRKLQRKAANEKLTYTEKLEKRRTANRYRTIGLAVILVALILLVIFQYNRHVYTGYDVVTSVERAGYLGTKDNRLGNHVLTYSKDGVYCSDIRGNVTWNQTYEIQDNKMAASGNTVAIGEYNGTNIYVMNAEKPISNIATTLPLRNLTVSDAGFVTAVLDDDDCSYLNTYNPDGELIFQGQAHMNSSGYPIAVSLSPNGELLCVSFLYVDAGVLKTNIKFYNFGSVGANANDYAVSGFTYTDLLVPQVQFINNDTAFAVGDSRLTLYSGSHIPNETVSRLFEEEIKSVYYSDKYIGLVFLSEDSEHLYRMDVYNAETKKAEDFFTGSYYFDIDYTDIFFGKDNFVVYNESDCLITTLKGTVKYSGKFDRSVRLMIPVGTTYKYVLVTDESLDTVQLR